MEFKEGNGWKACYDPERNLYTARISGMGSTLLEITKDMYDALIPGMKSWEATDILEQGRKLCM